MFFHHVSVLYFQITKKPVFPAQGPTCTSAPPPRKNTNQPTNQKSKPHLPGEKEKLFEGMSVSPFHNTEYVYKVFFLQKISTLGTHKDLAGFKPTLKVSPTFILALKPLSPT